MNEIAKVALDNEMDLIIAHKRSMRLAELSGLSLSAQTSFATAVSEVARNSIENGKSGSLFLSVDTNPQHKYIVASIKNQTTNGNAMEGLEYAKRLVNKFSISNNDSGTQIELFYAVPYLQKLDAQKLDEWKNIFRNEPSISPYEEIKRQNEQLQELSEKIQKSEARYKTLTNSLPLIIFSIDINGKLLYANDWLQWYTGETIQELNDNRWMNVVHKNDYDDFMLFFTNKVRQGATTVKIQARLKQRNGSDYVWHQVSISPFLNENYELQHWIGYIVDIHAQKVFEETLKNNLELKQATDQLRSNQEKLENYIAELNRSNHELQQFAFIASHDLQEPVRKLLLYSDYLLNRYSNALDKKGTDYLSIIHSSSHRMRNLVRDLLTYSQISKKKSNFGKVDLNEIARQALQDLELVIQEKKANIQIQNLPVIEGDAGMMLQLFENLLSNALKYSKENIRPFIDISCRQAGDYFEIAFKDNGIGFDEKYIPQIFTLFQRLHSREQYEGTGLGLAICLKIAEVHKGKIYAVSKEGQGASFFVLLPITLSLN